VREHFDEIEAAAYSVSLFTDWQKNRINEVGLKVRLEDGHRFDAPAEFFGAKRATKNLHPIAELPAENCTEQMGVPGPWYERLPHFRMAFAPSAGKELQSEYFASRENALDALFAVERLRDRVGPYLLISETRTVAADQLWMIPCYKSPASQFISPGSRLACGEPIAASDRERAGAISCAPLGKAVCDDSRTAAFALRKAA
jgi:alditol oxidase